MRNERWCEPNQIKASLTSGYIKTKGGGPLLYQEGHNNYYYTDESNGIFVGLTGTGKSRRGTIPLVRNIVEAQESFAVVDPKGEIFQQTACYTEKEYKTHVIDFRNILFTE